MDLQVKQMHDLNQLCQFFVSSPHHSKIGADGIYAILCAASSLGVDPRIALNGGMYYVRGKVELSAQMMNALIRKHGLSITKDKRSDETVCILHGKRCDTQDTWTASFSLDEAKRANLLSSNTWRIYPSDMLFARALSRLARQLFPDLIGNCYVEQEIQDIGDIPADDVIDTPVDTIDDIDPEHAAALSDLMQILDSHPAQRKDLEAFLAAKSIPSIDKMPLLLLKKVLAKAKSNLTQGDNNV